MDFRGDFAGDFVKDKANFNRQSAASKEKLTQSTVKYAGKRRADSYAGRF